MATPLKVVYLGVGKEAVETVRKHFKGVEEITCSSKSDLERLLSTGSLVDIHLVMAGPAFSELPLVELAQSLRMAFQNTPVYFVSEDAKNFERPELMKNGFTEVFLLPLDREQLGKVVAQDAAQAEHRVYSAVRLVDIEPGTRLDFQVDVFLPANNKFITYLGAGDVLEEKRLSRLAEFKHNQIYVPATQINAFHDYSARRLKELGQSNGESATVRQEKLRNSVRELMTGMISDSYSRHLNQGKKVIDHTRQIVRQFILMDEPGEWYKKLNAEMGQKGDDYTHSSSVATFAALFALLLKVCRTDEIAMAALLHDIGMAGLPAKLQTKRPDQMTPEEKAVYQTHPRLTLEVMQARKLAVPDGVLRAVKEHHEKWDGTGFPERLSEKRFSMEGQVLALADRFDYLTRIENSISPMSSDQAVRQLERERIAHQDLMKELRLIFERELRAAS